jgi:hypothetical protein
MGITWADVVGLAPELFGVPISAQDAILTYVNNFSVDAWGDDATLRLGRIYMSAHLGTKQVQASGGGATGEVTSETVGRISRTFKVSDNTSSSALDTTAYGQLWKEIASGTPARAWVLLGC